MNKIFKKLGKSKWVNTRYYRKKEAIRNFLISSRCALVTQLTMQSIGQVRTTPTNSNPEAKTEKTLAIAEIVIDYHNNLNSIINQFKMW